MSRRGPRWSRCLSCGRPVRLCTGPCRPRFLHHHPLHTRCYRRLMGARHCLPRSVAVFAVEDGR